MCKTAVVTGGSHNIGQGIAIVLAEHGYDVAITYKSSEEGASETRKAVEALGRKCYVYQAALEIPEMPQQVLDRAHKDLGHIDLMVCNAANPGGRSSILNITPEVIDTLYQTNLRNYMLCAGAAARYMVADKVAGNIIFITSTRAEMAYVDDYLYGGLKAAVKRATESIALDLSAYNIRVNCVAPGAIWPNTPRLAPRLNSPFVKESIPLHRVGNARDIGEAVAYVASDAASYITGTTLRVDGGLILPGMTEGIEKVSWVSDEWRKEIYDDAMRMVNEKRTEFEA